MKLEFEGRVAVVTGAAQGIGRQVAADLQEAGAKVHAVDSDAEGVRAVADELGCAGHVVDIANRQACHDLVNGIVETSGKLDILVLVAGGVCGQVGLSLDEITEESWAQVFRANVQSILWITQATAPHLIKKGWGRIVTISSNAGVRPGHAVGLYSYTSAKHGAVGLTRQLSVSLARFGVTVNSIAPGLVLSSPAPRKVWEGLGSEGQQRFLEGMHAGRLGTPKDVSAAAIFLASDQASWITGQVLSVDGGRP
ncbi:SDR family oxidoreductase [Bradyrhizobium sp. 190]|uniref:SDR family NAD(P)-dependent oxidoreductase n=1 Tax=Bradyrhizobium sp. 190 TaxID=2782658 RepID=UPI001FFA2A99|nr:SDR family NAD(P)-dependent oxidoreductase [Bradyrhizobium sp. 190]MCK1513115.1 SDR family oxidoreductase [Bradyrhizobium sp. 190]